MVTVKTKDEIARLREGGKRLGAILRTLVKASVPGASAQSLNVLAEKLVREGGDPPSFLNYKARGSKKRYPASLCISINDRVVHGLPSEHEIIRDGDVVSLDMGLIHQGMYVDSAVTIGAGKVDPVAEKLIRVTEESLRAGIKQVRAGRRTGDIGYAIEKVIKPYRFGIVRELAGHGVGYAVHEEPFIPNYGEPNTGVLLKTGMVLAIEPMVNEGGDDIVLDEDGFTFRTKDGKRSAHFEHTVLVTAGAPEVLTD